MTDVATSSVVQKLAPQEKFADSTTGAVKSLDTIKNNEANMKRVSVPSNSAIPNLGTHVQNAINNANYWTSTIYPAVVKSLQSVKEYSDTFNGLYKSLSAHATTFQKHPDDFLAKDKFKSEITKLQTTSNNIYTQSTSVQPLLADFQSKTDTEARDFQSDMDSVQSQITGDQQAINTYREQMSNLRQRLAEAEAKKEALNNPFVVISTFGISAIVSAITNLQGQVNSLNQQLNNDYGKLNSEQRELQALQQVAGRLTPLLELSQTLQTSMLVFISGWQALSDNLKEMEGMEKISADDSWAEEDLEAVNKEWQDVVNQVNTIA